MNRNVNLKELEDRKKKRKKGRLLATVMLLFSIVTLLYPVIMGLLQVI